MENRARRLPLLLLFLVLLPGHRVCAQRGPVSGLSTQVAYHIHYGSWDATRIANARDNFSLVILEPRSNITAADIANIQSGPDQTAGTTDDVLVLGYISIGEDNRPTIFDGFGDIIPVAGGTGPRVDPRMPGDSLADTLGPGGTPTLGLPSPAGTGYASFYVEQEPFDGLPDRNSTFGGAFVNAGDPAWYDVLRDMTIATEGVAGLLEILTTSVGKGLGCDGIFMDTLDTCAPDSFGATAFEWTAPGYEVLVERIAADHPAKLLLANRGLFFYSPNFEHYQFTLRPHVDLVMFESYYTDSSTSHVINPFFNDNKFNVAPKLNAEANRVDGFTVVALGYDEPGPLPPSIVAQDFIESQREQGWMLYRTNAGINAPMNFEPQNWIASNPDTVPPVWDNTELAFAGPSDTAPAPRAGIQEVIAGDGQATVRWDVARDQTGPVRYNIYYSGVSSPGPIGGADWQKLGPVAGTAPANYTTGAGAGRYANEHSVTGLANGVTYSFSVRAEDSASTPHEDQNAVILAATPISPDTFFRTIVIDGEMSDWNGIPAYVTDPSGDSTGTGGLPDLLVIYLANDDDYLYVRMTLVPGAAPQGPGGYEFYFDADADPDTGFAPLASPDFGSDMLMQNGGLFEQAAGVFNAGGVGGGEFLIAPDATTAADNYEFRISRAATYASSGASVFGLSGLRVFTNLFDSGFASLDVAPDLSTTSAPTYEFVEAPTTGVSAWHLY